MILAEKIMSLRRKKEWSQEKLAEQLGVSRQSVSKWESLASIPDIEKIIRMSELFGVSTDYLLKDDVGEEVSNKVTITETESREGVRSISMEMASEYLELSRKLSVPIAFAVMLCIYSPICLLLLGGLSEYPLGAARLPLLSEDMAAGIGMAVLLIMIAAAVSIFILEGMKLTKYDFLDKERISLQYGVEAAVLRKKESYENVHRMNITIGVALCILSVVPLMLAMAVGGSDLMAIGCVCVLLMMVGIGVFLFVRSGMIYGGCQKLLQEADFTPEKKELGKRLSAFSGFYWCLMTAVYLGYSFYTMHWERSWIIWPVAGVLYAALVNIFRGTRENSRRD